MLKPAGIKQVNLKQYKKSQNLYPYSQLACAPHKIDFCCNILKTLTTLQEIRTQKYRNWVGQGKPEQIQENISMTIPPFWQKPCNTDNS